MSEIDTSMSGVEELCRVLDDIVEQLESLPWPEYSTT